MITVYLDEGCDNLKASQGLKLKNGYSAIWFRVEKGDGFGYFIRFLLSVMSSFLGFFWLASSGGTGSAKILDIKRAFGAFTIPKNDIISKHEIYDVDGEKLYSDIAQVSDNNSDSFVELLSRQLFGVDSTLFFLPKGQKLPVDKNIIHALDELLIERNTLSEITETLNNSRLVERYIDGITELDGIATIVLRDSNMSTIVATIGNQFLINNIWRNTKMTSVREIDESEFLDQLEVGVGVSVLE